MSSASNLHQTLRRGTAAAHRATERILPGAEIMAGTIQPKAYAALLQTHARMLARGYALADMVPEEINEWLLDLRKAIALDLLQLDTDGTLAALPAAPITNTPAAVVGTLYVILGATLGGKMIYEKLSENEALQALPHHYFAACASGGKRWPGFLAWTDAVNPDGEKTVTFANAVFTDFQLTYRTYSDTTE